MRRLRAFISSKDPQDDLGESEIVPFDTFEMEKIWRGLFYCYWMSDKDDIQQEFACNLASSIHLWSPHTALLYFAAFLHAMGDNWHKIDHHRMNKFLALTRRMLEATFIYMRVYSWDADIVEQFSLIVSDVLRQVPNKYRGLSLHLIELYLPSWATSFTQDVYFNDLNIDQIIKDSKYDENMSLEEIYYQKYLYRKEQRHGKEAQERWHARKAARREGAAPLDSKYTREARKAAKAAAGRPSTAEGKLLHTSPIAFLLHRKVKKVKMVDTPDISKDNFEASRKNLSPVPDAQTIQLLDVLLNCYKLSSSDAALFSSLQDNFKTYWKNIVSRFIDDAEYEQKGEENPIDETSADALGHTAAATLRAVSLYLREKATDASDAPKLTKSGKAKIVNVAELSLIELPSTTRVRKIYNSMASSLESQIARLVNMGIDFDELENGDFDQFGEGEFDPSMMFGGEGEFDPSMFPGYDQFDGGEGELDDDEIRRMMEGMNGEGEFADDFDVDGLDDDQNMEEDFGEGEFDPSMMLGEGEFEFASEGEFDPYMLGGEGEFDMYEDEDHDDDDDAGDDDNNDDDDFITKESLLDIFGPRLKFDKKGQPILTPQMVAHLQQLIMYKRMKAEADAIQSVDTKRNTKYNQLLQQQYVPTGKDKWTYGFGSDHEDEKHLSGNGKRKIVHDEDGKNNNNKNKKQKRNDVEPATDKDVKPKVSIDLKLNETKLVPSTKNNKNKNKK
jgi:hypothetical protein